MQTVRDAAKTDLPQIKKLALLAWLKAYDGIIPVADIIAENEKFYTEDFHGLLLERTTSGLHLFKLLEIDQVVSGLMDFDFDDDQTWLMRFYLLPELIGKGLGKLLMCTCEKELLNRGRRDYFLMVHQKNTIGISFYTRNGFTRFPKNDRPSDGEICYHKMC